MFESEPSVIDRMAVNGTGKYWNDAAVTDEIAVCSGCNTGPLGVAGRAALWEPHALIPIVNEQSVEANTSARNRPNITTPHKKEDDVRLLHTYQL
jgi:hypothetical protein